MFLEDLRGGVEVLHRLGGVAAADGDLGEALVAPGRLEWKFLALDPVESGAEMLMRLVNEIVRNLPPQKRRGLRPIKLFMLRPSVDLGKLAGEYELKLGGALRLLTRGLGTEETQSSDWLSMLLFQDEYIDRLVNIGWQDARRQHHQIARFLDDAVLTMVNGVEGRGIA